MLKLQKGPFFGFFYTMKLSKFLFLSDIMFCQSISNNFFHYYPYFWLDFRSEALDPNFWRYVRTILRFNEEEAEVRKRDFFMKMS